MPITTGVIGAGIVSQNNHLPALARNPRTELAAVCDLDAERAREAGAEYGCRTYTDVDTMFEREGLEWAHVATPVQTHAELALRAIDAGVATMVQKPATVTSDELARLREAADDAGVPVSVVHNWLYYPVIRLLRRRVRSGEVGEVRAVETVFAGEGRPDETYRGDWVFDLSGGDLEEGIAHPLYLALGVGGYPRSEDAVDATARSVREYDRDVAYDGARIQYVAEGGALCSIAVLSESARDSRISVYGTEKALHVDIPTMTIDEHDAGSGPYHFPNERIGRNAERVWATLAGLRANVERYVRSRIEDDLDRHTEASVDGHYYLFDQAAKALERGRQPPVHLELSRWTLTLLEAVREAADREAVADQSL